MKVWFILGWLILGWANVLSQGFDLLDKQETYQGGFSQTIKVPFRIKNTADKAQVYVIRKIQDDLNDTQKGYFCLDKNCQEPGITEFSRKLEPGETLQNLVFTIETGLISGQLSIRFEITPLGTNQSLEHNVTLNVDERFGKSAFFNSKEITIHDVYPNPVTDQATIEYAIHNDQAKAKVVINNILGKGLGAYELPVSDTKIKILTDELPGGVYFYTLYVNGDAVFTRKLMVRK
jgi:Secretion system C-terminal sorting domain